MDPIAPPHAPMPISPATPRCAVHPDHSATLTCPYCGSYACVDCTFTTSWNEKLCVACETVGRSAAAIPWDNGRGFFRTVWATVRSPKTFFGRFPLDPSRPLLRPFALASSASIAVSVAIFVGLGMKTTEHLIGPNYRAEVITERAVGVVLVGFGPAMGIGLGLFSAASMALLARLGGKQLRFRAALRAGLYMGGAALLAVPLLLLAGLIHSSPYSEQLQAASWLLVLSALVGPLFCHFNALRWLARRGGSLPGGAWVLALTSSAAGLAATASGYFVFVMICVVALLTIITINP